MTQRADAPARVALVTGAGSGIGRAVARAFLDEGYCVGLAGRRAEPLEETVAVSVAEARGNALVAPTDVRDRESVRACFAQVKQRFGRLDVLFNNAGLATSPCPLEDVTFDDWQAVVETNLTGPFLCTQEAFRAMKSQRPRGGRIINNGSVSAHAPRPHSAPYTSTKHAITGLTKASSLDGREYDIACGQIDIGNAATEVLTRLAADVVRPDGASSPEPTMQVADVARAVVYMASLPLTSNVQFLTVMATKMPLIGRG